MNKEQFTLISRIYDASIDQSFWPSILDMAAPQVGAKGSALLSISLHNEYEYSCHTISTNYSRSVLDEYEEKYAKYEEKHFNRVAHSEPLSVNYDKDWEESPKLFAQRPDVLFLKENLGIYHRCAVKLNNDMEWFDCLTFQYENSQSKISKNGLNSIEILLPHFSQAMNLSKAFGILNSRFQAVLGVLDKYLIGVLLVLPNMDVVLANKTAEDIISNTGKIGITANRKLVSRDLANNLKRAIANSSDTSMGENIHPSSQFNIVKENGIDNLFLEISPIKDTNEEINSKFKGAIVTIFDSEQAHALDATCLKEAYKLSKAETIIANHYIQGKTYSEISEIRSVSAETIKSQVGSILNKTNSINRIDLINLIIRVNPPIEANKT